MSFENEPHEPSEETQPDIAGFKAKLTAAYEKSRLGTHAKITDFIDTLKSQYTKEGLEHIRLYHLLAGSTPKPEDENAMEFDLPGGEIANFINSLEG